ncbi:hypothetical protein LCGC14_1742460, partial [marine sediment metagenome]
MIRRCTIEDLDFVDSVLRHDSVYPFIADDHSPPVEEFTSEAMLKNPDVYFLTTNEFTVILAIPILNNVVYDFHINMMKPEGRGKTAKESLKEAIDYMFHDTKCLKLVGFIAVIFGNFINDWLTNSDQILLIRFQQWTKFLRKKQTSISIKQE